MMFFASASTAVMLRALKQPRPAEWILYAALIALGVWSQFVTVYVAFGHALWLAVHAMRMRRWQDLLDGGTALALAAIITLTLYSPMIPSMLAAGGMFVAQRPDQPRIFGSEGWHALLQLGGSWYAWAAAPGLIAALIGFIRACNRREAASGVAWTALLGLPLMVLTVALSGSWIYARFTLFAFPGAVLLIALGLDALWARRRSAALIGSLIIAATSMADLAVRPPKQPIREALDFIRAHQASNDVVVEVGLAHPVARIYANGLNLESTMRHGEHLAEPLTALHPRWLLVEYPRNVTGETYSLIERAGFVEAVLSFDGWADWGNGEIRVYERR
jgi:hypothetical protein